MSSGKRNKDIDDEGTIEDEEDDDEVNSLDELIMLDEAEQNEREQKTADIESADPERIKE